jgi:hypothetical protein
MNAKREHMRSRTHTNLVFHAQVRWCAGARTNAQPHQPTHSHLPFQPTYATHATTASSMHACMHARTQAHCSAHAQTHRHGRARTRTQTHTRTRSRARLCYPPVAAPRRCAASRDRRCAPLQVTRGYEKDALERLLRARRAPMPSARAGAAAARDIHVPPAGPAGRRPTVSARTPG